MDYDVDSPSDQCLRCGHDRFDHEGDNGPCVSNNINPAPGKPPCTCSGFIADERLLLRIRVAHKTWSELSENPALSAEMRALAKVRAETLEPFI